MVAGAALFARAYTLRDAVLPGVSVAGVDLGGLSHAEAQAKLQAELGPRLHEPVRIAVGEEVLVIRPSTTFALDVAATEERAYLAGRGSVLSRLGALVAPFAFGQDVEPDVGAHDDPRRHRFGAAGPDAPSRRRRAALTGQI